MTLYKGNTKIKDTPTYGVYKGNQPIGAIYKGSDKVYMCKRVLNYYPQNTFQEYKVPSYVTKIQVDCVASKGYTDTTKAAGFGGRVQCKLSVTSGQTLYLMIGDVPISHNIGAYNASDIRTDNTGITDTTSLQSRLVVAGGGGATKLAATVTRSGQGGAGGGLTGGNGVDPAGSAYAHSGKGGTQSAGGAGGSGTSNSGASGSFGVGGHSANAGGDGGAGWYGGGQGGRGVWGGNVCGGGGGGSSYTHPSLCSEVTHTQGYQNGAGYITITEIE